MMIWIAFVAIFILGCAVGAGTMLVAVASLGEVPAEWEMQERGLLGRDKTV